MPKFIFPLLFLLGAAAPCPATLTDLPVVGLYEDIHLLSAGVRVKSLVDTGAELSSIDIALARQLKLDGPVVRDIYIRTAHGTRRRKVVKLKVKLKDRVLEQEFTLSERQHMKQKVLLGRNVLKGFLVKVQ